MRRIIHAVLTAGLLVAVSCNPAKTVKRTPDIHGAAKPPPAKPKRTGPAKPIWLVITTSIFEGALKPLASHRRGDGFDVRVSTKTPGKAIKSLGRRPAFILLVGDDHEGEVSRPWRVPTRWRKLYRWRAVQRRTFASDALWGDLDGDLIPDVPVGRIPVRTTADLGRVIKKILAHDRRPPGPQDLRVLVWTGAPGYSAMIDSFTTQLLLQAMQNNGPRWASYWTISADPRHSLCGWPPDHSRLFNGQLRQGGAFAVLMGHASVRRFHSMRFEGQSIDYTEDDARAGLATGKPGPPLVLFSCSSGSFTGDRSCLAETLLLLSGGPVVAIAATTESHPMTNYFSGKNILQALGSRHKRLGSLWLSAQRQAMNDQSFLMEKVLSGAEGSLEPEINTGKLRRDQILMYALLGDPATRTRLPGALTGKIQRKARGWRWTVQRPAGATRLHVSFRKAGQKLPQRGKVDQKRASELFQRANATFAFKVLVAPSGEDAWQGTITQPGTLRLVATGPGLLQVKTFELRRDPAGKKKPRTKK